MVAISRNSYCNVCQVDGRNIPVSELLNSVINSV